jgi:threonine dehydrogenase-like Zn-dependent dehydrogenase
MRALVLRDYFDMAVEERPDPQAGPGQVVVELIATGICGSDLHGYSGKPVGAIPVR